EVVPRRGGRARRRGQRRRGARACVRHAVPGVEGALSNRDGADRDSAEAMTVATIPAWYEAELVTRGTEIDTSATVGMPVGRRYVEHLRWMVMAEPALGLVPLIDAGHFFVVRSQTIELRRRVGQGTRLMARSRMESAGRSTATVVHEAHSADGLMARARVLG